jgi:SAM-dependent methyltransferase
MTEPATARASWLAARRRGSVERFDTRFAATYDAHWGDALPSHLLMIERLLDRCPPRPDILDAACGTGRYWPQVLPRVRSLHGFDQSAGMLRRAGEKFPEVPTEVRALTDVTARDAYDAITCIDAMEYVPPEEWPIVLAGFHRALRSGGHLYLTVEETDPAALEAEYERALDAGHPVVPGEAVMSDDPDEEGGYHYYPTRTQVEGWLEGTGFEIEDELTGDDYWHVLARRG